MRRLWWGPCSLLLALGTGGFVACATSDVITPAETPPEPQTIPAPDAAPDADAGSACGDAGFDADAACALPADCTTVDFCSTTFPVTRQTALNAVWGSGPSDVWAVGTRGTILHGDGTTFVPVASGTDTYFAVWGTGKSDVWTVNATAPLHSTGFASGAATFTSQKGATWNASGATSGRIWTGHSTSPTSIWLAGDYSSRFGPSSSFWQLASAGDGGADGGGDAGDAGADAGIAWLGTSGCASGQFCISSLRSVWATDADHVWAVGPAGQGYALDPATQRFTQLDTKTSSDLLSVWASGPSDVWAVGLGGTIIHTTTAGGFAVVPSPTTRTLHALWGTGPKDIWAVGDGGVVIHYDGDGWTLATISLGSGESPSGLLGVWGSGPDDVWIVGEGLILHRTATNRRHP